MTTKTTFRHALLATGLALAFAACSGAATPASTATSGGTPASAAVAPTTAAASVEAPTQAAASADARGTAPTDAGGLAPTEAACALVTKADVATAVGFPIATVGGAGGTCFYQNAEPSRYLSIQLMTDQAGMALPLELESTGVHVSGLGDDAFWLGDTGMMFVRKGNRAILILNPDWVMTPATDTAHLDAMTTLARAALPNL